MEKEEELKAESNFSCILKTWLKKMKENENIAEEFKNLMQNHLFQPKSFYIHWNPKTKRLGLRTVWIHERFSKHKIAKWNGCQWKLVLNSGQLPAWYQTQRRSAANQQS